jgi:hypothetical protein
VSVSLTLTAVGTTPDIATLDRWLTEQGEVSTPTDTGVRIRGVPVEITAGGSALRVEIAVEPYAPMSRISRLVFELSVLLGGDVLLDGLTELTQPQLWWHLAEEQDRRRLSAAIEAASQHEHRQEMLNGLWAHVAAVCPGADVRWRHDRLLEVQVDPMNPEREFEVPVPVGTHVLAFRWLAAAWPSLLPSA